MSEERLKEIKDRINKGTNCPLNDECTEILELYNELIRLREELSKCTRKHWQNKCAEHCINEKILQSRIEKAIEYIEQNEFYLDYKTGACIKGVMPLLNILRGEYK